MSTDKRIRILCVDDHAEIRRLFELILQDHPDIEIVGSFNSADGLEENLEKLHPDVVVLDLSMPGRRPAEAMKSARAQFPNVRFLVSSSYDDEAMIQESLNSGAAGYLIKESAFDGLADAIRKVARGEKVTPSKCGTDAA